MTDCSEVLSCSNGRQQPSEEARCPWPSLSYGRQQPSEGARCPLRWPLRLVVCAAAFELWRRGSLSRSAHPQAEGRGQRAEGKRQRRPVRAAAAPPRGTRVSAAPWEDGWPRTVWVAAMSLGTRNLCGRIPSRWLLVPPRAILARNAMTERVAPAASATEREGHGLRALLPGQGCSVHSRAAT